MRWDSPKRIAGMACIFILANSVFGMAGQLNNHRFAVDSQLLICTAAAVLIGGQIGSRLTVSFLNAQTVKTITAVLVLIAAVRILYKHLIV